MAWRKRVVRILGFTVVVGLCAAAWAYVHWTNPAIVRQQVIARLGDFLPGASVSLDSAYLRLLGGISLTGLDMTRRNDSDKTVFAHLPSGTIYHDKQKLLDGKLVIRKLEFSRPVLHIIRRQDGTWNLDRNILATPDPRVPVPMIVLQQGTVFVEDQLNSANLPPLEIKSVNLTIRNDPLPTLVIEGSGVNDILGPLRITGSWGRTTGDLLFSLEATKMPIEGQLIERLAPYCSLAGVHARQLTGIGKLRADLSYQPRSARPWSYELHAQLSQGRLRHANLPHPLEKIEAKARCVDGQVTVEGITAESGPTRWKLTHLTFAAGADSDVDGRLEIQHLPADQELFTALPDKLRTIERDYSPAGNFSVSVDFARRAGQWREHALIQPEGVTASYSKFPYSLDKVRGNIDQELDPAKSINRVQVDLAGYTGTQPIYIQGKIDLKPVAIDLKIWGKDLPIDGKLQAALQPDLQKLVRDFSPSGWMDLDVTLHRSAADTHLDNQYLVTLHGISVKHAAFPYPIENASGTLDIRRDGWEFRDFHGTHKGGEFRGHGASAPGENGKHLALEISGSNVLLDAELEAALKQPALKTAWKKLAPRGRINFKAIVDQLAGQEPDIGVTLALLGCEIYPEYFPYLLTDLRGLVHYQHNEIQLQNMTARHGLTQLQLKQGKVNLYPGGDLSLDLVDVGGLPIVPDDELFRALPRPLGEACARLQLKDPLSLLAHLIIKVPGDGAPPYISWDGGVRLRDATLSAGVNLNHVSGQIFCRGEHHGVFGVLNGNIDLKEASVFQQTFRDIHSDIHISKQNPTRLDMPNLKSHLYGGDAGGEVYIDFGPNPQFELNLIGSQLMLEEFGRMNRLAPDVRMQGMAGARLYLRSQGFALGGLEGGGNIEVPSGKMYNLPFLLDLLKVLNLRVPDKTAFEEAHIQFAIRGQKVHVNQLSLIGSSVSLNGQGSMNLDGTDLSLDFYSVMGHITQMLPPVLDKLPPLISQQLLKIKVRGNFSKPDIAKEPVPLLVEPVKDLLKMVSGRQK